MTMVLLMINDNDSVIIIMMKEMMVMINIISINWLMAMMMCNNYY